MWYSYRGFRYLEHGVASSTFTATHMRHDPSVQGETVCYELTSWTSASVQVPSSLARGGIEKLYIYHSITDSQHTPQHEMLQFEQRPKRVLCYICIYMSGSHPFSVSGCSIDDLKNFRHSLSDAAVYCSLYVRWWSG